MGARVPHRLGLAALVPLGVRASSGGDGVDDLPVGEGVPVPVEVGLQIPWGPGGAGADDEADSGLIHQHSYPQPLDTPHRGSRSRRSPHRTQQPTSFTLCAMSQGRPVVGTTTGLEAPSMTNTSSLGNSRP